MTDRLLILDTTLRSGAALSVADKIDLAVGLSEANVDIVEAGYPAVSTEEYEAVRDVAETVRGCRIGALVLAVPRDVETAGAALQGAADARLHVYARRADAALADPRRVEEAVRVARNLVADVEFSLTDATRADPLELAAVVRAALSAGARTINVTDGGFILPDELVKLMTGLLRDVPELERAALSFHGHDDLGVAVANAIAAVRAGARQVEVAVDGLGSEVERNTPLDKVVRAVKAHRAILGVDTRVDVGRLGQLSELVRARTSRAKA